jgi:hypothetical protein
MECLAHFKIHVSLPVNNDVEYHVANPLKLNANQHVVYYVSL